MKKLLLVVFLLLVVSASSVFGLDLSNKSKSEIASFKKTAATMDDTQKMFYLKQNEKNLTTPLLLNIFLGFGIGSYVEGDSAGGTTALIGELLSLVVYTSGYVSAYSAVLNNDSAGITRGTLWTIAGLMGLLGFRVYEIVRPITYTNEYNRQLTEGLQFGIVPVVEDNKTKMLFSAKYSY